MRKKQRTKKKDVPVRDTTVVVAVGCGGIFYHGLSRMATFCNRRERTRIVLIDPDKVEEKNAARQWGTDVGMHKVIKAGEILGDLTIGNRVEEVSSITMRAAAVDNPKDLVAMLGYDKQFKALRQGETRYWDTVVRVVVVCAPDNHLCRMNVHKGCGLLASETGVEVLDITAGNGPDYGYAYGCVHRLIPVTASKAPPDVKGIAMVFERMGTTPGTVECRGDWTKEHPDIVEEAKQEARRLAHPASCGAMEEVVPGQTMITNQLTAGCVWDLAEAMVDSAQVGEVYWTREKDPRVEGKTISVIRAKLTERT